MGAEGISERISTHLNDIIGLSAMTVYLLAAMIAIVIFRQVSKKKYRLPPGPVGLPIISYGPFLGKVSNDALYKLSKKYGSLISCYVENKLVVANDFTSVKEVLGKDEFLNRPKTSFLRILFHDPSLATENGQVWKEQRRFTLHQLRDLGFGKSRLEEHIQEEISCFVKELIKYGGKLTNLRRLLSISTANNIRFLVFGHRTDYDDPRSNEFEDGNERMLACIKQAMSEQILRSWVNKVMHLFGFEHALEKTRKESLIVRNLVNPSEDTTLLGYDIPKDAIIFTNIWAVHHDPSYWKNPEKFDPTRFLSEDGKKYIKRERLIPFSLGRRSCPGETMASVEVFLYRLSFPSCNAFRFVREMAMRSTSMEQSMPINQRSCWKEFILS